MTATAAATQPQPVSPLDAWLAEDDCKDVGGRDYVRLLHRLATTTRAKRIAEIGIGWCYSGRAFCHALAENGGGTLISIDPIDGLPLDSHSALAHLQSPPAGVSWTWVPKTSHDVDSLGEPVDILYIDGDPRWPFDDAMRFYKDVKPGGLLILDGIGPQDGPNAALAKFKSLGLNTEVTAYSDKYSVLVHRKAA